MKVFLQAGIALAAAAALSAGADNDTGQLTRDKAEAAHKRAPVYSP